MQREIPEITTRQELQFQIDFSDDEEYNNGIVDQPQHPDLGRLPPLSLGAGAKASIRVDEVQQKAKRYSTSSRFSIPIVGVANYNELRTNYSNSDSDEHLHGYRQIIHDGSATSSPSSDDDEDGMEYVDLPFDENEPFNIRLGSSHYVSKAQIALSAPGRSSFSSSTGRASRDDFDLVSYEEEEPTLNSLMSHEQERIDPFHVPPPTPIEPIVERKQVDLEEFCAKLGAVHPLEFRRLQAFVRPLPRKQSPASTPQNIHEPQAWEKLVAKVFKMTPPEEDVIPFYDGVYGPQSETNTPWSPPKHDVEHQTPIIVDECDDDEDQGVPLPPEDPRDTQLQKFRQWFERHNLNPAVIDLPHVQGGGVGGLNVIYETFMTPSPKLGMPPGLDSNGHGGMSSFSNSSGATTDISRLGVTPSPMAPTRPDLGGKLEQENERLLLEVRSRTSALDHAVSEMGQMQLEVLKLKQQLENAERENSVLREQVTDLVDSKQKILVSADRQFDICRRKFNPTPKLR